MSAHLGNKCELWDIIRTSARCTQKKKATHATVLTLAAADTAGVYIYLHQCSYPHSGPFMGIKRAGERTRRTWMSRGDIVPDLPNSGERCELEVQSAALVQETGLPRSCDTTRQDDVPPKQNGAGVHRYIFLRGNPNRTCAERVRLSTMTSSFDHSVRSPVS